MELPLLDELPALRVSVNGNPNNDLGGNPQATLSPIYPEAIISGTELPLPTWLPLKHIKVLCYKHWCCRRTFRHERNNLTGHPFL